MSIPSDEIAAPRQAVPAAAAVAPRALPLRAVAIATAVGGAAVFPL